MTEYDYSPEGYHRHLETQQRIARWVDTAEAHRHQFSTPFGPRSDVDEGEQWDGVDRSRADNDRPRGLSTRGPSSQFYYPSPAPTMAAAPTQPWHQTRDPSSVHYPHQPPALTVITPHSKRKSSKSHKSHKSSSRARQQTYIIQSPIPSIPTGAVAPLPPSRYGSPNIPAVTYITTDHTGYPVTHTAPLHQIPGSVYSYSTPPAATSSPPMYSNPPPMMSPYTTPTASPLPGSPYRPPQPNVVFLPPNTRTIQVMIPSLLPFHGYWDIELLNNPIPTNALVQ
ncbi:hypothetical protein V5O48_002771 [Marasmius crinis-equi]|uniref:Uncharacterized protein n=1 Tax=Marasmius crinis-equi TaxID=585013 RepID=A0ABR3FUP0_9AGAR